MLSEHQFRAQFTKQPEESIPDPGEPPEPLTHEDIPATWRGKPRSDERRSEMAEAKNYEARKAYRRLNAPYQEAQRTLADRGVGLPGSHGSWSIADFPQPETVKSHGDYHIASFTRGGIAAFHGDQVVGRLQPAHNAVHLIEVAKEHRRKGIATAMFHTAQDIHGPQFRHGYKRTTEGDTWAKAVGGPGI